MAAALGALAALLIIVSPGGDHHASIAAPFARLNAHRIQLDADREHALRIAARIESDAAQEYAAAVQRQNAQTARTAPVQTPMARPAPTTASPAPSTASKPAPTVIISAQPPAYVGDALRSALAATSWPVALWPKVASIVACESGGLTTARNGVHVGLMQQNVELWGWPPSDAAGQLEAGYAIYKVQGFAAWSCA